MPFINGKYVPAGKTDEECGENMLVPEIEQGQVAEELLEKEKKKNTPARRAVRLYGKLLLTVFLVACIIVMLFGAAASNANIVVACLALMLLGVIAYFSV